MQHAQIQVGGLHTRQTECARGEKEAASQPREEEAVSEETTRLSRMAACAGISEMATALRAAADRIDALEAERDAARIEVERLSVRCWEAREFAAAVDNCASGSRRGPVHEHARRWLDEED